MWRGILFVLFFNFICFVVIFFFGIFFFFIFLANSDKRKPLMDFAKIKKTGVYKKKKVSINNQQQHPTKDCCSNVIDILKVRLNT